MRDGVLKDTGWAAADSERAGRRPTRKRSSLVSQRKRTELKSSETREPLAAITVSLFAVARVTEAQFVAAQLCFVL